MDKQENFINKVKEKYGDKIDTTKVKYVNNATKVCLVCHEKDENGVEHGEYWQLPSSCIRGRSCPKCANKKRGKHTMTTEKFKIEEKKVHKDKYILDETIYTSPNKKVCIICPKHGKFYQLPYAHLNGQGCPKCNGIGWNTDLFIQEANIIHKGKYNYDKTIFEKMKKKVCITCNEHGDFWQTPQKHLKGQGCPICGNQRKNKERVISFEEFVERANIIHQNKYKYHPQTLDNLHNKVLVECTEHGQFWQIAHDHLCRHGCPTCNLSLIEKEIKQFFTENNIEFKEQKKFSWLGLQSLDFYLPQYKIAVECQGQQHFDSIEHFGGVVELNRIKERDNRKLKLCTEHGIKILYYANYNYDFPYKVFTDKNELLNEIKKIE